MKIFYFLLIFEIFEFYNGSIHKHLKNNINENKHINIIHFIKCGQGDAILIEGNGHYGLVDSGNHYENFQNNKNNKINSKNCNNKDKNESVILDYSKFLKIKKLDFIIGTHAHSDHIGGFEIISKQYIDNKTIYYYKKYNPYINKDKYINYKIYLNTMNSIRKRHAEIIDVTNKNISFNFGDMNLELIDIYRNLNQIIYDENQNSILILINFKNTKIFLSSDMTKINDIKVLNYLGRIKILKFPHHGFGDTSIQFLKKIKPENIIISSNIIYFRLNKLLKFIKNKFNSKIYILKYIQKRALKLNLCVNGIKEYHFNNNYVDENLFKIKNTNFKNILIIILLILFIMIKFFFFKKFYKYIKILKKLLQIFQY